MHLIISDSLGSIKYNYHHLGEGSAGPKPSEVHKASQDSCGFCSEILFHRRGILVFYPWTKSPEAELRELLTEQAFSFVLAKVSSAANMASSKGRAGDLGSPKTHSHCPPDNSLVAEVVTKSAACFLPPPPLMLATGLDQWMVWLVDFIGCLSSLS